MKHVVYDYAKDFCGGIVVEEDWLYCVGVV